MQQQTFRSRFGLIVALMGLAVGTGNIWRFPRVMAANGGAAFLIPWMIFLFMWSIPLLIVEFSLGQKLRQGVIGCFAKLSHGKLTWLGGFVVLCTVGIMFYYSVVTGWCLHYLKASITGELLQADAQLFWKSFTLGVKGPLLYHFICFFLAVAVIVRGVRRGIEAICLLMVPALVFILIGLAVYSMTLSGREVGMQLMFFPDFARLADYRVWLEALTQSAWSTGAGWGIVLTYSCYAREHDPPALTSFTTGFGNNSIELLAAMVILPTLFTFLPVTEVKPLLESGNTGLTFIALPDLFAQMPMGQTVAIAFFTALFFAAFSSLISMVELAVRSFQDLGVSRNKSIPFIFLLGCALGAPSAISMRVFENQDWVWGVGLLLSGFFFSVLMHKVGMRRFYADFLPIKSKFYRRVFALLILCIIPLEFFALLGWWFYQSITWDPQGWWNPLNKLSLGTCLLQWGIVLFLLLVLNSFMNRKLRSYQ